MTFQPDDGSAPTQHVIYDYKEGGVAMGMYNTDSSIRNFAKACMIFSLGREWPLYLSTKNTILKKYDGRFKGNINTILIKIAKQPRRTQDWR